MKKQELIKNRLDLEYNHESHKANSFLAFMTTGLLGFIASFIWLKESSFVVGFAIALFVIGISLVAYYNCSKRMKNILSQIENL